ncbi:putative ABC transport system permease protein [Paenibacillus forsythiae]|uniref:ABC transport system permease protein n=1 Tax=Paenibacillus forsythiae TaxID=365616 RepID=A0ABU3HBR7_9BACL|nr:ABC transporter permease [Paenibacillus forsythiae]MDT3428258.1 putative ABC transport system permease protein [Paenibacillus forsythiae]
MFRIKDALRALSIRWVISILLLVQFTYGLSTIAGTGNIFFNLHYLKINSVLDFDSTYLVVPGRITNGLQDERYTKEQVEEIYNKLKNHKDVISFGTYYADNIVLDTKTHPLDSRLIAEFTKTHVGFNDPFINTIVIDENYYRLLNLKLSSGHGFSAQDFRKNSTQEANILAGSYFKKYYKTGDLINDQYRIIGFLPDKYIVNNNTSNVYLKLDKAMILPMPEDRYNDYNLMLSRLHLTTILKLRPGANLEQLTQIIQFPGDDVKLSLRNLGEDIRHNIADNTYSEIPQMVLGLSFILFSVIGIVVTTMVSIMIRKREFGIKLALGESTLGIFSQITIENVIIGITGIGLSLVHFMWKYKRLLQFSREMNLASPLDLKMNGSILIIIFLVFMTIISISSFFVYLFLRRQELKSLIGGME